MNGIANYDVYTARMKASMYDKIFFVDKIFDDEVDTILDFGCADGELIRAVHAFLPNYNFVGYDNDKKMIHLARQALPFARFTSDWNEINVIPEKTILVMSSVIHEVYSYSTEEEIEEFWSNILNAGFKYIVLRDMLHSSTDIKLEPDIISAIHDIINKTEHADMLKYFEDIWGVVDTTEKLKHFLLKYRYRENWNRESRENYLPITDTELIDKFTKNKKYNVLYDYSGPLPYLMHQVQTDFGLNINSFEPLKFVFQSHLRLILQKTY